MEIWGSWMETRVLGDPEEIRAISQSRCWFVATFVCGGEAGRGVDEEMEMEMASRRAFRAPRDDRVGTSMMSIVGNEIYGPS
jgi:hypothetical protein